MLCPMLLKLSPPRRLTALLHVSTTINLTTATAAAADGDHHPAAAWVSDNHTYRKHPRLRYLEQCRSLRHLKPLLAYALVFGLFRNPFVASRLLYTAAAMANLSFATLIFSHIDRPNLFSWNTLIRALAVSDRHPVSDALNLYVEMLHRGVRPDNFTLPFLLKSCNQDLSLCRRVHSHALMLGLAADAFVHTALVTVYLDCGCIGDALQLFGEISNRDVVAWTAVISGLVGQGCHAQALEVFGAMRLDSNVEPNALTIVAAISASAGLGLLDHARGLHAFQMKVMSEGEIIVWNALVDAYGKCGSIGCAARVFDWMSGRDLHSWTAMIMGFALHGLGEEALSVFARMQQIGVKPDSVTFVAVLSACSHAGLVDEGIRIFESMESVHAVTPDDKHCGCMVDLFSRAGLLTNAYEFIMSMPAKPNLAILGALLSACRICNNLELGELVAKKIESLCQYQGGAPVLLSNMYANQNQWHEVVSIRKVAKGRDGKAPGRSWIEVQGVVHEFVVEDRFHPLYKEMHSVLDGLGKVMEGLPEGTAALPSSWPL